MTANQHASIVSVSRCEPCVVCAYTSYSHLSRARAQRYSAVSFALVAHACGCREACRPSGDAIGQNKGAVGAHSPSRNACSLSKHVLLFEAFTVFSIIEDACIIFRRRACWAVGGVCYFGRNIDFFTLLGLFRKLLKTTLVCILELNVNLQILALRWNYICNNNN